MKVDLGRRTTELTKTSLFKSPQDRSLIRSRKILNHIIYPLERDDHFHFRVGLSIIIKTYPLIMIYYFNTGKPKTA